MSKQDWIAQPDIEYRLVKGTHPSPQDGLCAMEFTAYLAGEPHSDQPVCVSPILRSFCIELNDRWDDEMRQRLRPYLVRCIGTTDDGRDEERGYLCLDWQIRTFLPAWLRLAGLTEEAERVAELESIVDLKTAKTAGPIVREARTKADAARAAAWAAAWDAAGAAAWDAAGAAARDAAWAAAWAAAWDAAGDAAGDAARDAAGDAAGDAARDAAWAAAWAAAGDVLAPTVRELQESALDLLDRMLPTETITLPEPAQREYDVLMSA